MTGLGIAYNVSTFPSEILPFIGRSVKPLSL
jgi:hypothetical protein